MIRTAMLVALVMCLSLPGAAHGSGPGMPVDIKGVPITDLGEYVKAHSTQRIADRTAEAAKRDIQALLRSGEPIDGVYGGLLTPLGAAVNRENEPLVRLLIELGADPNAGDGPLGRPLHWAIVRANLALVRLLLDHGADPNAPVDGFGMTPLIQVFQKQGLREPPVQERLELVTALLDMGADVNGATNYGLTALDRASYDCKNMPLLRLLLSRGAAVNQADLHGSTALDTAKRRCAEAAAYLKGKGAVERTYSPPADNAAQLAGFALRGDLDALRRAPLQALTQIVGRAGDGVPSTPLHLAVERGTAGLVGAFAGRGVNWNVRDAVGRTPLHVAVVAGHAELALQLREAGAGVRMRDAAGQTPLAYAIARDRALAIALLEGAPEGSDDSALPAAIYSGDLDVLERVLRTNRSSERSLRLAVRLGDRRLTSRLAERTPRSLRKWTPEFLDEAAEQRRRAASAIRNDADAQASAGRAAGNLSRRRGRFQVPLAAWSPSLGGVEGVKLTDYPISFYVPEGAGQQAFGVFVFLHGPRKNDSYPNQGYSKVLAAKNLIWAGFSAYNKLDEVQTLQARKAKESFRTEREQGPVLHSDYDTNLRSIERNFDHLAAAIVHALRREFNIDPQRIYVGGFSYGGGVAVRMTTRVPALFKGAIAMSAWCFDPARGDLGQQVAAERTAVLIASGDADSSRLGHYAAYGKCLAAGVRRLRYMQVPKAGHELLWPGRFAEALDFLDGT